LGARITTETSTRSAQVTSLQSVDAGLRADLTTETANRVSGDNAVNLRVTNLNNSTNSSFSSAFSQIYSLQETINNEMTNRSDVDKTLLEKIDMLFLYFFRQPSKEAYIDKEFQIHFYKMMDPNENNNNNN